MGTGNKYENSKGDLLTALSNSLSLLGADEKIVSLVRNANEDTFASVCEQLRSYNYDLTTQVKSRLANCVATTVDVISHKLN